ncbi:MAG: molecular chaperone HtpG, partial [Planctomycetota bacterium]
MADTAASKSYEFKADVKQLLDILTHSVYTSKDVFLRELISNATDALEKARFLKVRGDEIHDSDAAEEIRITTREDGDKKYLTIRDSGIGMTADELQQNLGTIAHSGATAFVEQLQKQQEEGGDLSLIGRFGIGFYSVFMAGDSVIVTTRAALPDAQPVIWTSSGVGNYTITDAPADTPRGTQIEIELRADEGRFCDSDVIKSTIRKYSNFVPFPIYLDDDRLNETTALWREPEHQVSDEQYNEFFQFLTYEPGAPRLRLHMNVDVPLQFSALLFVPESNSEALGFGEGKVSLQLYVKRVLIDGENEDLLPKFLRFVKGVVESEDLPLSISREALQENRFMMKMKETLTRKLLGEFQKMADERPEDYVTFWRSFGRILKEGYSDFAFADKLHDLLRFNTSASDDDQGLCGLSEYIERMPEGQEEIYYLTGASRDALDRDPRLEIFRQRGVEVFYLYDMADEFVLGGVGQYKEKRLVSADQVKPETLKGIGGQEDDEKKDEADTEAPSDVLPLIDRFKAVLGERVVDVRSSERLVDSPACLVAEDGVSSHMERVMRMMNKESDLPKRILEINPEHSLIKRLSVITEKDNSDPFVRRAIEQIFEGSMLAPEAGPRAFVLHAGNDPHRLARVYDL